MPLLSARGLIRFDVEDYLTVESDDALARMLSAMRRAGLPGSYGLVGKKIDALRAHGRTDILETLKQERAIGFHSLSHSEHPTIAEEMATLDYPTALARFQEREGVGSRQVAQAIKSPRYFTQPGGNWIPEAVEGLLPLGMDTYFTDSFNSYVVDLPAPYWYGEVLLYSFPVVNPRPFGLGLPGNLGEAVELVEAHEGLEGAFMVMLHPTELVTHQFWDVVNFAGGATRTPLIPAPIRTRAEQDAALKSFEQYLQEIRRFNIEWSDSESLKETVEPRRPVTVARRELSATLFESGLGPVRVQDGHLSAAEALYALAKMAQEPKRERIVVPYVAAPEEWEDGRRSVLSETETTSAARELVLTVEKTGRLPSHLGTPRVPPESVAAGILRRAQAARPQFVEYIKAPDALHWDWPIFPPGFRPMRLWRDARRLAWTLKPAVSILD